MSDFFETNLWTEKYRPRDLDQIVLDESAKNKIKSDIENRKINNYLFYGPPGTGKTTLARIIFDKVLYDNDNVLMLNGSSERTLDILRNNITNFLSTPPFGMDELKIVFIDEADYLTDNFFGALRNFIEKYASIGRFIFTCNYINKIPAPIQSRFSRFELKPLNDDNIKTLCYDILNKENVEYKECDVDMIINVRRPDIRSILELLQQNTYQNKLNAPDINTIIRKEDKLVTLTIEMIISKLNKNPMYLSYKKQIEELIMDKSINFTNVLTSLFHNQRLPDISKVIVNKYCNSLNGVVSYSMHYMACIYEIIDMVEKMQ